MRTKVFAYKGIVGIDSTYDTEGLINDPLNQDQVGFMLDADYLDITQEAIDLLKTIQVVQDEMASIAIFKAADDKVYFGWMGGCKLAIDPKKYKGDNSYDASLLTKVCKIIVPEEFKTFTDEYEKMNEQIKIANQINIYKKRLLELTNEAHDYELKSYRNPKEELITYESDVTLKKLLHDVMNKAWNINTVELDCIDGVLCVSTPDNLNENQIETINKYKQNIGILQAKIFELTFELTKIITLEAQDERV
jgi:hypothetical protein